MDEKFEKAKTCYQLIREWDRSYYDHNTSLVSDAEYDLVYDTLTTMLKDQEIAKYLGFDEIALYQSESPLKKVKHRIPILSLDKIKMVEGFQKKLTSFQSKYMRYEKISLQPKLDGLTCVIYQTLSGPLFVTRGGGKEGEDITHQFVSSPLYAIASKLPMNAIVRGELILPKSATAFYGENAQLRNIASGLVRRKAATDDISKLRFVAYDLPDRDDLYVSTILEILRRYGFETIKATEFSIDEIQNMPYETFLQYANDLRDNSEYQLDGLVIKPDYQYKASYTEHHREGQIALKYPPLTQSTTLIDVEWNRSNKDGRFTPIAIFKSLSFNGSTIERASLGSYQIFKANQLKIGDVIQISLANDVIPHFDCVVEHCGTKDIIEPSNAYQKGAHLFSTAEHSLNAEIYCKFCRALNLRGVMQKRIQRAIDLDLLNHFSDLFTLYDTLDHLNDDILCTDSSKKFFAECAQLRENQLSIVELLVAMQIPSLGKASAIKQFRDAQSSWDEILHRFECLYGTEYHVFLEELKQLSKVIILK